MMIFYWNWIGAVVATFFLGINSFVFWPMLVVLWGAARVEDPKGIYWLALGTGLLADLLTGRTLGVSAIYILLSSGLVFWYRSRGQVSMVLFLGYSGALSLMYKLIWG